MDTEGEQSQGADFLKYLKELGLVISVCEEVLGVSYQNNW